MNLPDKSILKRSPSLAEQIYHHLCSLIEDGTYEAGGKFPSETELSKSMEVSRPIIREALSRMKHDGLISSTRGGRAHVTKDTSGHSYRINTPEGDVSEFLTHLYELRAIIEPEAAALAAVRASGTDLESIQSKLHAIRKAGLDGRDGAAETLEFHRAVIEASGNPYFAGFITWIGKKLSAFTHRHDRRTSARMMLEAHREHELIVAAISKKDPELARKACRYHIMLSAQRQKIDIDLPV